MQFVLAIGYPNHACCYKSSADAPHLLSLLKLPSVDIPCWTIGWLYGTRWILKTVFAPMGSIQWIPLELIQWSKYKFDHRSLISLGKLGIHILGATALQVETAMQWIPPHWIAIGHFLVTQKIYSLARPYGLGSTVTQKSGSMSELSSNLIQEPLKSGGQGSKGAGHFSRQSANNGAKGSRCSWCSDNGIHRCTRLPPFCIMFLTNNPGAWSEIGADPWSRTLCRGYMIPFVM